MKMAAPVKLFKFRRLLSNRTCALCFRSIYTEAAGTKCVKVGDRLPDITVYERTPNNPVKITDVFNGKKGILFSVPGAFNPGCTQGHIPEYLDMYDKFVAEGYSVLACVCVNDPFVLDAWAKELDPDRKLRMFADVKGEFTKAINMELQNSRQLLGNVRSHRYTLLVDNNRVTHVDGESNNAGLACLLCIQRMSSKEAKKPFS